MNAQQLSRHEREAVVDDRLGIVTAGGGGVGGRDGFHRLVGGCDGAETELNALNSRLPANKLSEKRPLYRLVRRIDFAGDPGRPLNSQSDLSPNSLSASAKQSTSPHARLPDQACRPNKPVTSPLSGRIGW